MPMIIKTMEQARRLRMNTGRALSAAKGEQYAPDNTPKYGPYKTVAPGREQAARRGRPPKNSASLAGVD